MPPLRNLVPLSRRGGTGRAVVLGSLLLALSMPGCESLLSPSQYSTIRVTTTRGSGEPVPDVQLTLYTGQRPIAYSRTDAAGEHVFDFVVPGNYGVAATFPAEYQDPATASYLVQDGLNVTPAMSYDMRFVLDPCVGALELRVVDGGGAPAAGIPAIVYSASGNHDVDTTSALGVVRTSGLSCRQYGVRLEPTPEYTIVSGRGTSFVDGIEVSRRSPAPVITMTVARCRALVRVVVLEASGAPVPAAAITVSTTPRTLATGTTGGDGRVRFDSTPCGMDLAVSIAPPAGFNVTPGRPSVVTGIRLADGGSTDVAFQLTRQ